MKTVRERLSATMAEIYATEQLKAANNPAAYKRVDGRWILFYNNNDKIVGRYHKGTKMLQLDL